MSRRAAVPPVGAGMVSRHVIVRGRDVVLFKGIIEASEGLASVYASRGGDLVVAAPADQHVELDRILADLRVDLGAVQVACGSEPEDGPQ